MVVAANYNFGQWQELRGMFVDARKDQRAVSWEISAGSACRIGEHPQPQPQLYSPNQMNSDDCYKQINNGSGIESDKFNYTWETAALSLVGRNVDFVWVIVGISQCAVAFQRHVRSEPPWPTLLRASLGCGSGPCGGTCQKRTGKQECSVGNAE